MLGGELRTERLSMKTHLSGIDKFDHITGGFLLRELIFLCDRQDMRKSTLLERIILDFQSVLLESSMQDTFMLMPKNGNIGPCDFVLDAKTETRQCGSIK
jgi:hypothetical protein